MKTNLRKHKYDGSDFGEYKYNDLPIHAGKGVHEFVLSQLVLDVSKDSKILILGAGSGAFDCRLFDNGFKDITSVDINEENYKYKNDETVFVTANLNTNFADDISNQFDVVIAIEVIEHLFSTDNFLKNCYQLMHDESILLISTPNPRSYASRLKFLLKGYHAGFEGVPLLYEHVNPIHIGIFKHHCFFNKLELIKIDSFDHSWVGQSLIKQTLSKFFKALLCLNDFFREPDLRTQRKSILFLKIEKSVTN